MTKLKRILLIEDGEREEMSARVFFGMTSVNIRCARDYVSAVSILKYHKISSLFGSYDKCPPREDGWPTKYTGIVRETPYDIDAVIIDACFPFDSDRKPENLGVAVAVELANMHIPLVLNRSGSLDNRWLGHSMRTGWDIIEKGRSTMEHGDSDNANKIDLVTARWADAYKALDHWAGAYSALQKMVLNNVV